MLRVEDSVCQKTVLLSLMVVFVMTCSGVALGMNSLQPMMVDEGIFSAQCDGVLTSSGATVQGCSQQLAYINTILMVTTQSATTLAFPAGVLLDFLGRRRMAISSAIVWSLSCISFGFSASIDGHDVWCLAAMCCCSLSMMMGGVGFYFACLTFAADAAWISPVLNAAWDTSAIIYISMNYLYFLVDGLSFTRIFVVYGLVVGAALVAFTVVLFPAVPRVQKGKNNSESLPLMTHVADQKADEEATESLRGAHISDEAIDRQIESTQQHDQIATKGDGAAGPSWNWGKALRRKDLIALILMGITNEPFLLWYMSTLSQQTLWILGVDSFTDDVSRHVEIFSALLFLLVPPGFVVGWALNYFNKRIYTWRVGFAGLLVMCVCWGTMACIPVSQIQYVTYPVFIVWRMCLWSVVATYLAENPFYPSNVFGRIFGLIISCSGLSLDSFATWLNLLWNYLLADLGNYAIPNTIFTVLCLLTSGSVTAMVSSRKRAVPCDVSVVSISVNR